MSDIKEKVVNIIAEHLGVDKDKIKENSSFVEDLNADSLDQVEMVMAFEEEFDCEIPDEVAEKMKTVGDVIKHIEENT